MTAPKSSSSPAEREGGDPRGLSGRERWLIAAFLVAGLALATVLMFFVPLWLVSEQDYLCPPAAATAPGQVAASGVSPSCLGRTGAVIDDQALSQARAAARLPFGVLSAGLLAGAAAAIGVVVSNHNAALTRAALGATVETNTITRQRDEATAARDRAAAVRERERAADERFTTAIEQLGHPSASVRLGGMHSLHRLAEGDPGRLPTVVDVLCAYLRQPFHHPDHDWNRREHAPDADPPARAWWPESQKEGDERDSEREVRSTATRLIPTLLPTATPPPATDTPEPLAISLNGAVLDGLDLSARRMGDLLLDGVHITGDLLLDGVHITGDLILGNGAHITGNLHLGPGAHINRDLIIGPGAHINRDLIIGSGARIDRDLIIDVYAHVDRDLIIGIGAHITGGLQLGEEAYITGGLQLDVGAYITGGLQLDVGAHITGGLRLSIGAHITGGLQLDVGAYITGGLQLDVEAYITGGLQLDVEAYITGGLQLDVGAYITGDLKLSEGAHITGDLKLSEGAHIDGDLHLEDGAFVGKGFDRLSG